MKRTISTAVILFALLVVSIPAWSLSITIDSNTIDVGALDTLIDSTALSNSGDETELEWVRKIIGDPTLTLDYKNESMDWYAADVDGVYAINFKTESPEYFLVKTGKITKDGPTHFLFANDESFEWGVINLQTQLGIQSITNIGKISHVDEFGGAAPVPEPATLLGGGLLGLAGFRKKTR